MPLAARLFEVPGPHTPLSQEGLARTQAVHLAWLDPAKCAATTSRTTSSFRKKEKVRKILVTFLKSSPKSRVLMSFTCLHHTSEAVSTGISRLLPQHLIISSRLRRCTHQKTWLHGNQYPLAMDTYWHWRWCAHWKRRLHDIFSDCHAWVLTCTNSFSTAAQLHDWGDMVRGHLQMRKDYPTVDHISLLATS